MIRSGAFADLTFFDPARVIDHSTYHIPTNDGIEYVIVNGTPVLELGAKHTRAKPGRAIRRGAVAGVGRGD